MKLVKNIALLFLSTICFTSFSQQNSRNKTAKTQAPQSSVGINNPNPQEALDITGNLNLTGTIKTNGNTPIANQQLITNGSGTMQWADIKSNFQNFKGFAADENWIVPAGVNLLYVELWGAGGGGGSAGGGGGGYGQCLMNIIPSETISIKIGAQGTGSSGITPASNGGFTRVASSATLHQFIINGGFAGNSSFVGRGGSLGGSSSTLTSFKYLNGISGKNTIIKYAQKNATTFLRIYEFGKGGDAANSTNTGGDGAYLSENESNTIQDFFAYPISGSLPGGGGGASSGFVNAANGAQGYAVIYWK